MTINTPEISVRKAKILYSVQNGKSSFSEGDFGTDLESFQILAGDIVDLKNRGLLTSLKLHETSRYAKKYVDSIGRVNITDEGMAELGKVTGDWLQTEKAPDGIDFGF